MLFAKYIQIEMQIRFSRQCLISCIPWFTNGAPTETHCGPITTPQNSIAGKLLGPILCSPNIIIHQASQPDNLPSLVQGPIVVDQYCMWMPGGGACEWCWEPMENTCRYAFKAFSDVDPDMIFRVICTIKWKFSDFCNQHYNNAESKALKSVGRPPSIQCT